MLERSYDLETQIGGELLEELLLVLCRVYAVINKDGSIPKAVKMKITVELDKDVEKPKEESSL